MMFAWESGNGEVQEGQMESHCDFVDLEKSYDKVLREELRYDCMRESGGTEMYVRVVQDMCEDSETVVRRDKWVQSGGEITSGIGSEALV